MCHRFCRACGCTGRPLSNISWDDFFSPNKELLRECCEIICVYCARIARAFTTTFTTFKHLREEIQFVLRAETRGFTVFFIRDGKAYDLDDRPFKAIEENAMGIRDDINGRRVFWWLQSPNSVQFSSPKDMDIIRDNLISLVERMKKVRDDGGARVAINGTIYYLEEQQGVLLFRSISLWQIHVQPFTYQFVPFRGDGDHVGHICEESLLLGAVQRCAEGWGKVRSEFGVFVRQLKVYQSRLPRVFHGAFGTVSSESLNTQLLHSQTVRSEQVTCIITGILRFPSR